MCCSTQYFLDENRVFQLFSVLALISFTASFLQCMYADHLHTSAKQKQRHQKILNRNFAHLLQTSL